MGYPGALALLAQSLPAALDDHRFLLAVCVGEVTDEQMRGAIERGFRCPVMDLYSGSEFGPVAVEDVSLRRLFLCEETIFVELREPRHCDDLEQGLAEVVFTPFYNYAMPLIRYLPGDFAVADEAPMPDSRTLRRLVRVAGRDRNVFVLPSGHRWWPTYQNKVLRDFLDYKQIQFAQTAHDRIEVRFASDRDEPVKDPEALAAYLRSATPEAMDIAVTRVAAIARRPSGKYEYATCEIGRMADGNPPPTS
jgi:phenylacetate-CoA ligase